MAARAADSARATVRPLPGTVPARSAFAVQARRASQRPGLARPFAKAKFEPRWPRDTRARSARSRDGGRRTARPASSTASSGPYPARSSSSARQRSIRSLSVSTWRSSSAADISFLSLPPVPNVRSRGRTGSPPSGGFPEARGQGRRRSFSGTSGRFEGASASVESALQPQRQRAVLPQERVPREADPLVEDDPRGRQVEEVPGSGEEEARLPVDDDRRDPGAGLGGLLDVDRYAAREQLRDEQPVLPVDVPELVPVPGDPVGSAQQR